MFQYAYELDILNQDIINPQWKRITDNLDYWIKYFSGKEAIDLTSNFLQPDFKKILDDFYTVARVVIFNKPKMFSPEFPHIDGEFLSKNIFALNLNPNILDNNGYMAWYKIKNNANEPIKWTHKDASRGAYTYQWEEVEEDYRLAINNKITLVRTDLPHAVFSEKNPRYCVSIRFHHKDHSWLEIIENFKTLEKIYHNQKTNL